MTKPRYSGPENPAARLVLAHGAGAGMDSDFMAAMAAGLAAREIGVWRFEFPYMQWRREQGRKRPPDPMARLQTAYREFLSGLEAGAPVFIGGKSLGGRVAATIADSSPVSGLLCLGYPFHPPGKPEKLRVAPLQALSIPALILQGTRDAFGKPAEVEGYGLPENILVHWLDDGDHDFATLKRSRHTKEENWQEAITTSAEFIRAQIS